MLDSYANAKLKKFYEMCECIIEILRKIESCLWKIHVCDIRVLSTSCHIIIH